MCPMYKIGIVANINIQNVLMGYYFISCYRSTIAGHLFSRPAPVRDAIPDLVPPPPPLGDGGGVEEVDQQQVEQQGNVGAGRGRIFLEREGIL